jgi:hypothetical protein
MEGLNILRTLDTPDWVAEHHGDYVLWQALRQRVRITRLGKPRLILISVEEYA